MQEGRCKIGIVKTRRTFKNFLEQYSFNKFDPSKTRFVLAEKTVARAPSKWSQAMAQIDLANSIIDREIVRGTPLREIFKKTSLLLYDAASYDAAHHLREPGLVRILTDYKRFSKLREPDLVRILADCKRFGKLREPGLVRILMDYKRFGELVRLKREIFKKSKYAYRLIAKT